MLILLNLGILTSCGSNNKYTHKIPEVGKKQFTQKIDKLFFDLERAKLIETEQGSLFLTEWALRNTSDTPQKIRLSEKPNETYLLYGYEAKKSPLYGIGIGSCEGKNNCLSYINILPGQKLTFILKTPSVFIPKRDKEKTIKARLRARFEIKEQNYYTYPADIEFNQLVFEPETNVKIYHENK